MDASQTSQDPINCANGCGFFGNQSTADMCSKCYRDTNQDNVTEPSNTASNAPQPVAASEAPQPAIVSDVTQPASAPEQPPKDSEELTVKDKAESDEMSDEMTEMKCAPCATEEPPQTEMAVAAVSEPAGVVESSPKAEAGGSEEENPKIKKKVQKNRKRCFECRKKVGLTALSCKCGFVFCGLHRFPDQHNCDFDFKAHDRGNLAKSLTGGGSFAKMQKV